MVLHHVANPQMSHHHMGTGAAQISTTSHPYLFLWSSRGLRDVDFWLISADAVKDCLGRVFTATPRWDGVIASFCQMQATLGS